MDSGRWLWEDYSLLRHLDASHSGLGMSRVLHNVMLVCLSLGNCQITALNNLTLPNLRTLGLGP